MPNKISTHLRLCDHALHKFKIDTDIDINLASTKYQKYNAGSSDVHNNDSLEKNGLISVLISLLSYS